jgi:hypothetical protein
MVICADLGALTDTLLDLLQRESAVHLATAGIPWHRTLPTATATAFATARQGAVC